MQLPPEVRSQRERNPLELEITGNFKPPSVGAGSRPHLSPCKSSLLVGAHPP